jgi:4-diphosphocytidyl-2-C-methyl-D-erythritol kinase
MLTLKAPAKINWFLKILGKRGDGYHEIESLIQKVALYDVLSFAPSEDLILNTSAPIPMEQNLVYKAATLLKRKYAIGEGVAIDLEKKIPMGAGLGGGSSDAASALRGLNELWALNLSIDELSGTAEELGSDVPFFLCNSLSFVHGSGEKLKPCRALKPFNLLLVKPAFDVSTAWVYDNFAMLTKKPGKVNNIKHFISKIEKAEHSALTDDVSNDLESVTINSFPEIAGIKERLRKQGAVFSLMSGSGSAVFGVFVSRGKAEDASKAFDGYWTSVVETITD